MSQGYIPAISSTLQSNKFCTFKFIHLFENNVMFINIDGYEGIQFWAQKWKETVSSFMLVNNPNE